MITTHQLGPRPMKIGFCFLVKNSISNESLWIDFFKPAEDNEFSIYIHAKTSNVESILPKVFVDPNPLPTEWASISLVHATKRLLDTAFTDGCDSAIFLSGDSLPLWNFKTIQKLCTETLFSLQPVEGLYQYQVKKNEREYNRIREFYRLGDLTKLVKQNMFFCLKKSDYDLIKSVDIGSFPCKEVPDEYFWSNQLIMSGRGIQNFNYIFANNDPTKTQALNWSLDAKIIYEARSLGFLFIRKVKDFADIRIKKYYKRLIS